ncbi:TonB-dependent receptor [Dysgonomonas sp. 216]|uniref:TonB-dependent receptor n=1 Tax=Dysgonomonas sp. 216 TaxID=2302934 RepID=UPI0013D0E4B3|nr:TonB-dependent receptor [Dysgonomonas sp. 216]NDW19362.1 TonB-dependent receptor [Dysgonomonas sp. 216]
MKKVLFLLVCILPFYAFAEEKDRVNENDTIYTELKYDIVVLSSTKETNSLKSQPAAVSVFSPKNLEGLQVSSIKDISAVVPNFFIPNYGSKMTTPLYIRGIGARTGAQTVSLYIDNVPYFNPCVFDSELFDIQRVELLRGSQGTLYGRNSMGGIINIYTFSPLNYQGTTAAVSGGNYGYLSANASHYRLLTNNAGIAVSGYYKKDDGFFENAYTGKNADDSESAGGRIKYSWQINPRLLFQYSGNFDYSDQGAFPYIKVGEDKVNYDGDGSYTRRLLTNGITLQYKGEKYLINSTTGYQYLNDDMFMDQDYTPASIFKINQKQNQHSLSQEITIKSNTKSDYQWLNGVFGFYDYQKITSPVLLLEDGIVRMLQSQLDNAAANNPNMPFIKITDDRINFDGIYRKPIYGGAVFHQSTFNNIFDTEGLSFTVGLRLDYEKARLDYDGNTGTNLTIQRQVSGAPIIPMRVDSIIKGTASKDYFELLPRFALKYDIDQQSYVYVSGSRGYKTGGHNVQIFAELLSSALQSSIQNMGINRPSTEPVEDMITFDPEYSWTAEIGGKIDIIKDALSTNFAVYYTDVKDVQISQFAKTGQGRMTTNAGKAVSKGFEIGLKARPCSGFYLYGNYGFSDAKFKSHEYNMNNYIPFAPRQTVSLGSSVTYNLKRCPIIDRILLDVNYAGAGKIYWTEENDLSQGFYGTANARLMFETKMFGLEFWGKNILDRDYQAFYFESMGNSFFQKGKPAQWGVTLRLKML